jgi:hypothetical protein
MTTEGDKSLILPEDLASEITRFFEDKNNVLLVFVFGSTAAGKATPLSDVDVAVLFSDVPDAYEINDIRDDLAGRLKKEVDIAVLNGSSPILKMQVLKNGVLVFKKNAAGYNRFFVDTVNQYDDLKQTRKTIEDNILRGRIYAR